MSEHKHSYGEYQRLKKHGLPSCDGCRAKANEYRREWRRSDPARAARDRARIAAYDRALRRLAARHQVEFRGLLNEELANDERTRT